MGRSSVLIPVMVCLSLLAGGTTEALELTFAERVRA